MKSSEEKRHSKLEQYYAEIRKTFTDEDKELERLLENVDGSYEFFAPCTVEDLQKFNGTAKMIEYVKANPRADSSDVLEYLLSIDPSWQKHKRNEA